MAMLITPVYAHNTHKRVTHSTNHYQPAKAYSKTRNAADPGIYDGKAGDPVPIYSLLLLFDRSAAVIPEYRESKYRNDIPIKSCCGQCDGTLPIVTVTIDPDSKEQTSSIIPLQEYEYNPLQYQFGYTIYRDISPPSLLQSILHYRVLLI